MSQVTLPLTLIKIEHYLQERVVDVVFRVATVQTQIRFQDERYETVLTPGGDVSRVAVEAALVDVS